MDCEVRGCRLNCFYSRELLTLTGCCLESAATGDSNQLQLQHQLLSLSLSLSRFSLPLASDGEGHRVTVSQTGKATSLCPRYITPGQSARTLSHINS